MKFVKPGPAKTVALAPRLRKTGALPAVVGLVTQEEPVTAPVSGVLLEFAMRDVARMSVMMVSDVFARLVTLGRSVKKVCFV